MSYSRHLWGLNSGTHNSQRSQCSLDSKCLIYFSFTFFFFYFFIYFYFSFFFFFTSNQILTVGDMRGGRIKPFGGYVPPSNGMPLGMLGNAGITPGRGPGVAPQGPGGI